MAGGDVGHPHHEGAHLILALGLTAYILIAIPFEERNLTESHPEYAIYRRRVPMLIPRPSGNRARSIDEAPAADGSNHTATNTV